MTNNIKLSARKTSFILAVSCILFSVIATYLYINHQIDLTRYTTPIILGTVVIIITCGGLQRVFYIEEFYKLKYCSTVVYMVPRA